ncbi:MAG: FadR/GntR family transcriptional regulator, partial [Nevskiales bacterium]
MDASRAGNPLGLDPVSTSQVGAGPLARPRSKSLAHRLVDDISGKIRSLALQPGERLPTEAEIVQAYGVSRTVVREAISKLQAAGMVETRHGIGTFVLQPRAPSMFRLDPSDLATSVDVLAVLELRISLESESAGLAATRRSEAQLKVMRDALDAFERHIADSGDGVGADYQF